jgi:hypothetical protein
VKATLDCADSHAQDFSDLGVGELFGEGEQHDLTLVARQFREVFDQTVDIETSDDGVFR